MTNPQVILSAISPNGNAEAVVEQDERVAYFYLWGANEEIGVRSCWVRNIGEAPSQLDNVAMREGMAPMMPAAFCAHPQGAPPLREEELEVVWLEEGDAAALVGGQDVLAVIPAWSGCKGFHGYAKDCTGESPLAWALGSPENNAIFSRIDRARDFWDSWSGESSPWQGLQSALIDAYTSQLGNYSKYYGIDGGQWPPKAMLRIPVETAEVFVTLGMCIQPQPQIEMYVDEPCDGGRRIELGFAVSESVPEELVAGLATYMSGQTDLPWYNFTWLGEGHTIPCDVFRKTVPSSQFVAVLLTKNPTDAPHVSLPPINNDEVSLLWMVPLTQKELNVARKLGSSTLIGRLRSAGHGWIHRDRKSAV